MTPIPNTDASSPFQYVPVPNEHVPAVLAYVAGLMTSPDTNALVSHANPTTLATNDATVDGWTDNQLARFFSLGTKTSDTVQRMLHLLAEHTGEEVALSTREVAEALDLKYSEMKILPTNVTRSLEKHFPGLTAPWAGEMGLKMTPPRADEYYFWCTEERAAQLARMASA